MRLATAPASGRFTHADALRRSGVAASVGRTSLADVKWASATGTMHGQQVRFFWWSNNDGDDDGKKGEKKEPENGKAKKKDDEEAVEKPEVDNLGDDDLGERRVRGFRHVVHRFLHSATEAIARLSFAVCRAAFSLVCPAMSCVVRSPCACDAVFRAFTCMV